MTRRTALTHTHTHDRALSRHRLVRDTVRRLRARLESLESRQQNARARP